MRRYTLYNRIFPMVLAMLLVLTMLLPMVPRASAAEHEGSCGNNLTWSYELGVLTITGSGAMTDYHGTENVPWYEFREEIFQVVLPDGLTRVGSNAFAGCKNLTAITIPGSVREIGARAFLECTGLVILSLPRGLERIEENAFELCTALQDLRLPDTLITLERQAFYRCYGLRAAEVPTSVQKMGSGVFAYCHGLIKAVIRAPLTTLPQWTFYGCTSLTSIELPAETTDIGRYGVRGCENLEVVYYDGEAGDAEKLKEQISEENTGFADNGSITEEKPATGETSTREETNEGGDTVRENTTVTDTEDSTITVTEKENVTNPDAEKEATDISATVVGDGGWNQVEDAVDEALKGNNSVEVDVYVSSGTDVPDALLDHLSGKNVVMTVTTANGGSYVLDFNLINRYTAIDGLDLSYRLRPLEDVYEALEGADGFRLFFNKSGVIYAEVMIQLPTEFSRKTISLFQLEDGKPQQLQSVVADAKGVAHFYLASVDSNTEYLLGVDVPSVARYTVLIPNSLAGEYGADQQLANVKYVTTGRVSTWGVGFSAVARVLAAIMLSTAAIVGVVMYNRNKRKIRQGYVPGWDEEE